ncbi:MAG TPA: hypothetical protein DEG17_09540 [Cyanobacteria bacterium UBA11149]|nr:hypothetical protein [Cyanobacteria bacterium UBA11367]HBE59824.1 hypothetical protein [Cyanobacteria bacterium UBA11366]HBK65183.1 hypothetical protein [Cyanobacteria bacterium UBA11166]HBR76911.1 hypothetical protein [Cyanobacteria bacterium UBA11159]HBS69255.1 hypothetical protein [Cyanobacteria bacterium UBA11153]HBW89091.1 hypothetical protein [Cyanobacteria bacterium UBA11149]HCA96304.1 hypothetical protein [Cyanobacteria bacterium UBA9226]
MCFYQKVIFPTHPNPVSIYSATRWRIYSQYLEALLAAIVQIKKIVTAPVGTAITESPNAIKSRLTGFLGFYRS